MTVDYRVGDLFNQPDADALAHGVNCCGVMGAGIAKLFKQKLPQMYIQYKILCELDQLHVGDVMPWQGGRGDIPFVFNIASQNLPGPHAEIAGLYVGLLRSAVWAEKLGLGNIAIPRIGAGIGGLQWDEVREVFELVAHHVPDIKLIVVTHPNDVEEDHDTHQDSPAEAGD